MDLSKIQLLIKVDLYVIKHKNAKKKGKGVLHNELGLSKQQETQALEVPNTEM